MVDAERVSIGFSGGGVVEGRIDNAQLKELRQAVERGEGWFDIDADEGMVAIDLAQVVFIRSATTPQRIGFGGGGCAARSWPPPPQSPGWRPGGGRTRPPARTPSASG